MTSTSQKTGPKQHYIPQMLLRRFGAFLKRKGKKDIYNVLVCSKEKIRCSITENVGFENYFYSPKGDASESDYRISQYESNDLSKNLSLLDSYTATDNVDPSVAADFVAHLSVRTAHFRNSLAIGAKRLASKLESEIITNKILLQRFGVCNGAPNEEFSSNVIEYLDENYPFKYAIPYDIIVKILFFIMRENSEEVMNNFSPHLDTFFKLFGSSGFSVGR